MMRRSIALVLLAVLPLASCDLGEGDERDASIGRPTPSATTGTSGRQPLKIGLVATMNGPDGWMGEDAYEGADLGVHHVNRNMASGERRYELEVLDDRGDPNVALGHLRNLAARPDIVGIVYGGPTQALMEAEGFLERSQIPLVFCFGDLYSARRLRPHLFQAGPPYSWQARDIARYLTADRRYERIGVLVRAGSPDGSLAARMTEGALREYGIERPILTAYADDVRPALERLRDRGVEALVLQGDPQTLERIYDTIAEMGARYRGTRAARIASAPRAVRRRRVRTGWWRPQLAGFDHMVTDRISPPPPGTVATATYARGVHYLPIPSFVAFRSGFRDWWGTSPNGYEHRAYEATMAIGWAAERAGQSDVARGLEGLRDRRFGGLPVTLGPDDHLMDEEVTIGLWTVPSDEDRVRGRTRLPRSLPWVPLARGFSIDGETTDILTEDWKWLFRNPPPRGGPAPRYTKMKFGVRTRRSDPLH